MAIKDLEEKRRRREMIEGTAGPEAAAEDAEKTSVEE
jgi:hypothetical protein